MELIDTSAWVEYFRATGSPANLEVRRLLQERPASVVTTEPVVMELLAGAADERVSQQIEILTGGLRLLPVEAMLDYRNAALTYRAARRRGLTVRKLFDCLNRHRRRADWCHARAPGPVFRRARRRIARSAGAFADLIPGRRRSAVPSDHAGTLRC
jgi:predicted nucleic acid-binding protein